MTKKPLVLVIDDDDSLRRMIELTLIGAGYEVVTAEDGTTGLQLFKSHKPAVVITDVQMPDISGFDVLASIKNDCPETIVIIITAFGSIEKAVQAMQNGAHDYITKPFSRDDLQQVLDKALAYHAKPQSKALKHSIPVTNQTIVTGTSPRIQHLLEMTKRVANFKTAVLITGESGTGKEVFAHEIHRKSPQGQAPFITVNCAAIPAELLESELFGHMKGSFTGAMQDKKGKFEQAQGGTIFLDEIGEMPLSLQPKLLRVLQEKEVEPVGGTVKSIDIRVISATNRNLEQAIEEKTFREDLYYRLAVVTLELPPLRERAEDIEPFIDLFLHKMDASHITLSPETVALLKTDPWPGNIRELGNTIERMVVLRSGNELTVEDLPPKIRQRRSTRTEQSIHLPDQAYSLVELEKQAVIGALKKNNWNQSKAAEFLQIPRHILIYRMEKYQIPKKDPKQ